MSQLLNTGMKRMMQLTANSFAELIRDVSNLVHRIRLIIVCFLQRMIITQHTL